MIVRTALSLLLLSATAFAAEKTHKLEEIKKAPKGYSDKIAAALQTTGVRVSGPKGVVCELWLAKDLAVRPKFKPGLSVKYPFTPGQLLGAIRFPGKVKGKDFRGQDIKPGLYTLRYGLQPEDGNHLGTSEIRDFCMAFPAKQDKDPRPIDGEDERNERSAESAGTTHPAIFLLAPPPKTPVKKAKLEHDEEKHFWIVAMAAKGKAKDKAVTVPFHFVAVGLGE